MKPFWLLLLCAMGCDMPPTTAERTPPLSVKIERVSSDQITGEIVNTTGRKINARIEFALYDGDAKVGDARDRVYEWLPDERWKFRARTYESFTEYTLQRVVVEGREVAAEITR